MYILYICVGCTYKQMQHIIRSSAMYREVTDIRILWYVYVLAYNIYSWGNAAQEQ
jgi:hypothetical protein